MDGLVLEVGREEIGGGAWIDARIANSATSPVEIFDEVSFVGNLVRGNGADEKAGGAWLGFYSTDATVEAEVYNNTFTRNVLRDTGGDTDGEGVYLPHSSAWGYSRTIGYNNIVTDNEGGALDEDWFAEFGGTPTPGHWEYSILPDRLPPAIEEYNLFGPTVPPSTNTTVDPELSPDARIVIDGSSAHEEATSVSLPIDVDIDNEPRIANLLDIGGDEFQGSPFIRGDASGSGFFGALVDALWVLKAQFIAGSPPPYCDDAADANDNGVHTAVEDALRMIDAVFVSGIELDEPNDLMSCGLDPTMDGLFCDADCPYP